MTARLTSGATRQRPYDELAVQCAMQGRGAAVHPSERAEAIRRLLRAGKTPADIAQTLGCCRDTVYRVKAWLRKTGALT